MPFVDTDQLIESRWGRTLQEIIDLEGMDAFRRKEAEEILALDATRHVIATGGSVVYFQRAMTHLERLGTILWLDIPLAALEERLHAGIENRGVVRTPDQSLAELYSERRPLYERYADFRVMVQGKTDHEVTQEILAVLAPQRDA
jgi:shikimate kinase